MNEPCGLSWIDAIDNGRANNSWYLSCFVSAVRGIFVAVTGLAYIVRDFDNVFKRYPPEHTDAVLRQSVICDWSIKINR